MQMGEEMQGSPVSGQRVCVPGVRVCVCVRVCVGERRGCPEGLARPEAVLMCERMHSKELVVRWWQDRRF